MEAHSGYLVAIIELEVGQVAQLFRGLPRGIWLVGGFS